MISDLVTVSLSWLQGVAQWLSAEPVIILFCLTCLCYMVRAIKTLFGR